MAQKSKTCDCPDFTLWGWTRCLTQRIVFSSEFSVSLWCNCAFQVKEAGIPSVKVLITMIDPARRNARCIGDTQGTWNRAGHISGWVPVL
jgi:hypothetical protein